MAVTSTAGCITVQERQLAKQALDDDAWCTVTSALSPAMAAAHSLPDCCPLRLAPFVSCPNLFRDLMLRHFESWPSTAQQRHPRALPLADSSPLDCLPNEGHQSARRRCGDLLRQTVGHLLPPLFPRDATIHLPAGRFCNWICAGPTLLQAPCSVGALWIWMAWAPRGPYKQEQACSEAAWWRLAGTTASGRSSQTPA